MADIVSCIAAGICTIPILGVPAHRIWLWIEERNPNLAEYLPSIPSLPPLPMQCVETTACTEDRRTMERIAASLAARESTDAELIRRNADLESRVENLEEDLAKRTEELAEAKKDLVDVRAKANAMEREWAAAAAATKTELDLVKASNSAILAALNSVISPRPSLIIVSDSTLTLR